jgi:FtsP/CotA-like multicopper oxidase with cupredoxin domain
MAGALIVEGALDELPGIAGLPERLMVLGTAEISAEGTLLLFAGMLNPTVFVNGQSRPLIAMAPGETQRWRIVDASGSTFMNFSLEDHVLHQIASDGNPLRAVRSREQILLAPGERIEVLVQGGPPGRYALRSLPWGEDLEFQAQEEYPIATVISDGPAIAPASLPTALFPCKFEDLRQAAVDRCREVVFSELFDPFRTLIDGQTFDFVYHCHILDHEDRGMMGVVEVVA